MPDSDTVSSGNLQVFLAVHNIASRTLTSCSVLDGTTTGRRIPFAPGYSAHDSGAFRTTKIRSPRSKRWQIGHRLRRSADEQPELVVRQVERWPGEVRTELACSFNDRGGQRSIGCVNQLYYIKLSVR